MPAQTRILVVTDIPRTISARSRPPSRAVPGAGGGALGLFTAIARLKAVHERIAPAARRGQGLPLLRPACRPMSPATLVDIFRAEEDSCLLGTDAVRDGVDVPGRSLRLIVFDRVPWPRPDILHRARAGVRRQAMTTSPGCGCARPSAG
jgi:ATP-dependent DNA helicase DinG